MSHSHSHSHDMEVPRVPLMGMGVLVVAALLAALVARWQNGDTSPSAPTAPVVSQTLLRFDDRPDGGITVRQAPGGAVLKQIGPGEQPFVRGALRALVRERRSMGLGADAPFHLLAHADGRLTLIDTGTQRRLDIESFGPAQSAAFAQMLALSR